MVFRVFIYSNSSLNPYRLPLGNHLPSNCVPSATLPTDSNKGNLNYSDLHYLAYLATWLNCQGLPDSHFYLFTASRILTPICSKSIIISP